MYCKHCGSIQPDNASFCSHCRKPLDGNNENRKKNIAGIILAIIAVGCLIPIIIIVASGGLSDTSTSRATSATASARNSIKITAEELYQAYEENEVAADRKYGGQLVEITGEVDNIGTDMIGRVYITFPTGQTLKSVQCYFEDEEAIDGVASIVKGQTITVVGTCDGFTLNVSVKDCAITDFAPEDSNAQTSSTPDNQE